MEILLKKFTSIKVLTTFWGMGILTFIVVTNRVEFMFVAQILCGIPFAYFGANVAEDKIKGVK